MAQKKITTRIQNKHDIEANWKLATNFIPLAGELIVYDKDAEHDYVRFKVGDGITKIADLPFTAEYLEEAISEGKRYVLNGTWFMKPYLVTSDVKKLGGYMTLDMSYKITHKNNGTTYDCNCLDYNDRSDSGTTRFTLWFEHGNNSYEAFEYTGDDSTVYQNNYTDYNTLTFDNEVVTKEAYEFITCFCQGGEVIEAVEFLLENYHEPVQPDWNQTDETAFDFIKNKPVEATDEDILTWLNEESIVEPMTSASGEIYTAQNNEIYIL